jgi:enoyl-CoA hydratase
MDCFARYSDRILIRRDEANARILRVTLNRPESRNAADRVMHRELSTLFYDIARDEGSDVVILTGAGEAFSAGGDIHAMREKIADRTLWVDTVEEARGIFYGMLDCPKPVICRLRGPASGLGATLAVYSDIVIADRTAKIGDPHVKVGLAAGDGGALMWPLLCGFQKAKELLFLGDHIGAEEAQRIGLVNEVVDEDRLDARVDEIAGRLAAGALKAISYTKLAINQTLRMLAQSTMEAGLGYETLSQMTADHAEAVEAFAAKRTPAFRGR